MSDIFRKIDERVRERSLLLHPFYQAWSAGELSREALAEYAREYYQLVKAVPVYVDAVIERAPDAARPELEEQRDEEAEHVPVWARFAGALGVAAADLETHTARAETDEALAGMAAAVAGSFEQGAAALYALELEIPQIAQTKMAGLESFYGLTSDDALDYFREHAEADVRHAAQWRGLLADRTLDEDALMGAVERSLDAQNRLLDGCYEAHLAIATADA